MALSVVVVLPLGARRCKQTLNLVISPFSLVVSVKTLLCTHSVGMFAGVMTPSSSILSNF